MSDRVNNLANPNAELALLGSVFRANAEQRTLWASTVKEEWFTTADHVMACRVIVDLVGKALPIAPALVEDSLRAAGMAEAGVRFVESLARAVPTAELWQPLAGRVKSYYLRRRGVETARESEKRFHDMTLDPMEALAQSESEYFDLHDKNLGDGMRHLSFSTADAMKSIMESIDNRGRVTGGLATGFTDLDRMNIKGMRGGQVYFYGAEPGGGKTVLLMKMLWNLAMGRGDYHEFKQDAVAVGMFSLEMPDASLAERILIRLAEIELHSLDRGMINRHERKRIEEAVEEIRKSLFHIEYCPGMTVQEFRVKCRYAMIRYGLKAVGVDYVQLMNSSSKDAKGNRTQAMMDVSLGILMTAKECGIPVIALAQQKQDTWGKRAGLDAFAETSQLAKDADLVGLLGNWDRLKLGNQDEDGVERVSQHPDDPQVCTYLDIVKNRNGPNTVGKAPIKLNWAKDYFDFMSTTGRLFSGDEGQHQKQR
jgi:replicative DNA helicase